MDRTKQGSSQEGEDTGDQETGVQLHRTQAAIVIEGRAWIFYRWTFREVRTRPKLWKRVGPRR